MSLRRRADRASKERETIEAIAAIMDDAISSRRPPKDRDATTTRNDKYRLSRDVRPHAHRTVDRGLAGQCDKLTVDRRKCCQPIWTDNG